MSTDFTPVPVRPRRDGWTPERQTAFIAALAATRCITAAARAVGLSWQTAYRLRARPDAGSFAAAWDRAVAGPVLDPLFTGRALGGAATPVTYRGRRIGERRRYDNRLAMYLLSIRRPGRYGAAREQARAPSVEAKGAVAQALGQLRADLAAGVAYQAGAVSRADVARTSSPSAPAPRNHVPRPPPSAPVHPRVRRGP